MAKPMGFADLRSALLRAGGQSPATRPEKPKDELPEEAQPLDMECLDSLRRLGELAGKPLVQQIVDSFLSEAPQRLARLREALAQGNAKDLTFVAHSLKGSSAQLGAVRVAALSFEVEKHGASADLGPLPALLADLEREIDRVAPLLAAQKTIERVQK